MFFILYFVFFYRVSFLFVFFLYIRQRIRFTETEKKNLPTHIISSVEIKKIYIFFLRARLSIGDLLKLRNNLIVDRVCFIFIFYKYLLKFAKLSLIDSDILEPNSEYARYFKQITFFVQSKT